MMRLCRQSASRALLRLAPSLLLASVAAGCASNLGGGSGTQGSGTQSITIKTPGVADATCILTSNSIGTKTIAPPATIDVGHGPSPIGVRCSKQCYEDGEALLTTSLTGGYPAETQISMRRLKDCKPRA